LLLLLLFNWVLEILSHSRWRLPGTSAVLPPRIRQIRLFVRIPSVPFCSVPCPRPPPRALLLVCEALRYYFLRPVHWNIGEIWLRMYLFRPSFW
jgi:hypothetical protein